MAGVQYLQTSSYNVVVDIIRFETNRKLIVGKEEAEYKLI